MSSLWNVYTFLRSKKTVDETVNLLTSHKSDSGETFLRLWNCNAHEPEGPAALLVASEPVPEACPQYLQQFIGSVDIVKRRQLVAPQIFHRYKGRYRSER